MITLYLYIAFSYLFMIGCAVYEISSSKKEFNFIYFLFSLLAPITLPIVFGYEQAFKNHN